MYNFVLNETHISFPQIVNDGMSLIPSPQSTSTGTSSSSSSSSSFSQTSSLSTSLRTDPLLTRSSEDPSANTSFDSRLLRTFLFDKITFVLILRNFRRLLFSAYDGSKKPEWHKGSHKKRLSKNDPIKIGKKQMKEQQKEIIQKVKDTEKKRKAEGIEDHSDTILAGWMKMRNSFKKWSFKSVFFLLKQNKILKFVYLDC
jgi:hypothetical protein